MDAPRDQLSEADLAWILGPWRGGAGPLGQRLGVRLVAAVDDGLVPPGARLPTERALAAALGIARTTATGGYRYARDAGRLEARQGSGTWARGTRHDRRVPDDAPPRPEPGAAFDTLGRPVAGTIDLSLAETRCDHHTRAVLADAARADPGWPLTRVTGTGYHPQGLPDLRELVATHLAGCRAGAGRLGADDVLVTTGAQQAIALCATALAAPGATVLVEEASYPGALEAFRRAGLRVLPVPGDERGPDPRALADLVSRTRPALCYLIPVGNNPTGVVTPGERLDRLAEVLARTGVTVVEDRTAAPLGDPARVPAPLSARLEPGSVVTVGSTSKVAWAGLRTGWAVAAPAPLRALLAARVATDLAGSLVSQALAAAVLPHLPTLAAAVRADVAVSQAALAGALSTQLPGWRARRAAAGAWRWVRVPGDARVVVRAAAAAGVLVTPGPAFSAQAALTDHVRIAAVEPPDVLTEGVRRLAAAWAGLEGAAGRPGRSADGREMLLI